MSHGVIKLSPEDASYIAPGTEEGRKINSDIFDAPYLRSRDNLLTEGLCVPQENQRGINALIGVFFKAVQDASFAPWNIVIRGALSRSPQERYDAICGGPQSHLEAMTRCSTLSPDTLRMVMRRALEDFLRELPPLLDSKTAARIQIPEKSQNADTIPIHSHELRVTYDGNFYDDALQDVDLVTPPAHSILQQIDSDVPEIANTRLINMARAILLRANLSLGSTRNDVTHFSNMFEEQQKEPAAVMYSTLDPENLLRIMMDQMGGVRGLWGGVVFALPAEKWKKIGGRMEAAKEKAKTVKAPAATL